jgi:signal transduction histidine kinase
MEANTAEFLEKLLDISRIMAESRDLDSLLHYAMEAAMELVNARQGHLILVAEDGSLNFQVMHGVADEISHSVLNRVLESQQPLLIHDALKHSQYGKSSSIRDYLLRSIMCVPLISRERLLGAVYVENRSLPNAFQEPHLDVLIFFSKQAAVLIENAILTANLQKAREELVTTREEERRRIRRDLHDGLGPSLAALRLELQAARNLVTSDTATSADLLEEVKGEIDDILGDVRRIVYELRPPALDELGLVSAIEEYMSTCERSSDLQFELIVPEKLPNLTAAVEVAVYRIVMEAITNVIRHAQAQHCQIQLMSLDQMLKLEIVDDGQGLSKQVRSGVGLASMRERVGELGGVLEITGDSGVRIKVELPLSIQA